MKKINLTVITVIASLMAIVFLLLMNDIVISIRINELKASLQDLDRREGSIDNIGLVATYDIHKKLFENRISQDEADAVEERINSLAILEKEKTPRADVLFNLISFPALVVINANRMVLGKPSLAYYPGDDTGYANIYLAYYYERNFHFKRAIDLYDKSLKKYNLDSGMRAGVLLHQGYCYALSGYNSRARVKYLSVINNYGNESSAITATILLGYLEGFILARERILNEKDDPLLTSQNLVNLLAYRQALSILENTETRTRPDDLPRIRYYKARCFAGIGNTNKAAENYLQVITDSPSSRYALYANRRLFMAASSAGDEKIRKLSIGLNRKLKDPVLDRMILNKKDIKTGAPAVEKMVKIDIPPVLKAKTDTIIADIDDSTLKKSVFLVIFTNDGNIFKGTLIERTDDHISLMTSIGRIDVKKSSVTRITEK